MPTSRGKYKLSVNDFLVKACAIACYKVPAANSSWREEGGQVVIRQHNVSLMSLSLLLPCRPHDAIVRTSVPSACNPSRNRSGIWQARPRRNLNQKSTRRYFHHLQHGHEPGCLSDSLSHQPTSSCYCRYWHNKGRLLYQVRRPRMEASASSGMTRSSSRAASTTGCRRRRRGGS